MNREAKSSSQSALFSVTAWLRVVLRRTGYAAGCAFLVLQGFAAEQMPVRPTVLLENQLVRVTVDLGGGSVSEFRFRDSALNPISWSTPQPTDLTNQPFGHFLCLDRWGPASEAEAANGMPYHGEAAHVMWQLTRPTSMQENAITAQMTATLPIARLAVKRTIRLSRNAAVYSVREEVTNQNPLGRIYNMVQHPTIAPPFLDETTIVDCNGWKGFAQGPNLATPEERSFLWPQALDGKGQMVDLRHLTDNPEPEVVSYAIDGLFGWITAATPTKGLLVGYLWATADYPWVSLWRDVQSGHPAARGLEFGTTGLHQPFPILVRKGRVWNRQLFEYLDSGATAAKSYLAFLIRIPTDCAGVATVEIDRDRIIVREAGKKKNAREFRIESAGVLPNGWKPKDD